MKPVGTYNKIPADLQPKKLNKGETALYRLLDPVIDPNDPKKQKLIWPRAIKIPTLDVIRDPETGEMIDIGVVEKVDRDGKPKTKRFWVRGMENNGYFAFTGGHQNDDYFHWFFELTNKNSSNPNRDESIRPMFERIDRVAEAKANLKKFDDELEALVYVKNMSLKDLKQFAASVMMDENDNPDILRNKVKDIAKANPRKFISLVNNKDTEIKATIKRAVDSGVILFDVHQNKVLWANNNQTIATLPRMEGQDWLTGFADWINSAKNGDKVYESIKKNKEAVSSAEQK